MNTFSENISISVKPDKSRLINLLDDVYSGLIKVPVFQRDFVWKPQQMLELFDSIQKGYPIGSLLLWKPLRPFQTKKLIGPYNVLNESKNISYILDGFQRLSTLFGALINPNKFDGSQISTNQKEYLIYYNLKEKEFTYLKGRFESRTYLIPLYKIIDTFEFLDFVREIEINSNDRNETIKLIENAKEISKIFYDYELPFVEIKGGDIKSAVEIFSRINSTGTEISEDFMLSALSYNETTNFLFSENITEFINSLNIYNFQFIKRDTVLNCIANSKGKIYFDVKIEELLKPDLEILSRQAFIHIEKAVQFLNRNLFIFDTRLLPYPTQLIFISEFFRINPFPSQFELDGLIRWFWITTYSNYFTLYSLSQQRAAYKMFMLFASKNHPDGILRLNDTFETAKFPEKLNFTGVRNKALQLFLINFRYKNFEIYQGEIIRETFLFNKKDRTPGNIILRTNSEFEIEPYQRDLTFFINNTSLDILDLFCISPEMIELYNLNFADEFIAARETIIKKREKQFVESLGVEYDSSITVLNNNG